MLQHHLRRRRTVTTKGGLTLPRTGLLFYSRLPNAYLPIDWDEEIGWESPMLGYQATPGDDALFAVAPQLYDGDADTPLILSDSEILALSGINTTVNGVEVSFSVAAGLAVRWYRIAYIPNAYPFTDKDGGSTRAFQGLQYLAIPVGGLDFTHASILGTFTVTYPGACGADRITVAAGKITITAGDIWGRITINDGATVWGVYEVASALSATDGVFWDVSGAGRHLLFAAQDQEAMDALVKSGQRDKGSEYLDLYGYEVADGATMYLSAVSFGLIPDDVVIPNLSSGSGCAAYVVGG